MNNTSDENLLKKEGYWAIASQKHLKEYRTDSPNIDELGEVGLAGKAGLLLGIVRGNGKIENIQKIEKMATQAGVSNKAELHRIILPMLEECSNKQIELIKDSTNGIIGIEENIFDTNTVFNVTGKFFENLNPSKVQRIAITSMDETKKVPYLYSEIMQKLCNHGFTEKDINLALNLEEQFKMIRKLERGNKEPIFSNEYVWGQNNQKIARAIGVLGQHEKEQLGNVINQIQNYQGIPQEKLKVLENSIMNLAIKIGMIDPIKIVTGRQVEKEFEFSPNMLDPISGKEDIFDDVKLLLASIRFGENFTQHSTIYDAEKFLRAWITYGEVGPHTANATDYIMLEKKGIAKVEHKSKTKWSPYYGTYKAEGYYLRLIKEDVAKEALKYLENINGKSNEILKEGEDYSMLANMTDYRSPEAQRIMMGEMTQSSKQLDLYMQQILRDETI